MRKKLKNSGFTMAELLIVVGIIVVLTGVSFIAVQSYQRSMAQLERNTIAKELYFAAQNHLTMAESQGYLGLGESEYGTRSTAAEDEDAEVYYLVGNGAPASGTMLDLMLPFGSIDESVRSGGSYLIRYQPHPATVLDVFYCSKSGTPARFNHTITNDEYTTFIGYRNNLPKGDYVVGWYGGGEAVKTGIYLDPPEVEIINGDKLIVKVTDSNDSKEITKPDGTKQKVNAMLEIIISGETIEGNTAKAVILLNNPDDSGFKANNRVTVDESGSVYTVTLDDITTPMALGGDGMHFADLNNYATIDDPKIWFMTDPVTNDKFQFKPGENITVEAVSFSNSMLTNIAYSSAKMANSLFEDVVAEVESAIVDHTKVQIANFRHLENLDEKVSGFDYTEFMSRSHTEAITATQTKDLLWAEANPSTDSIAFTYGIGGTAEAAKTVSVYKLGAGDEGGTPEGCYLPIEPGYTLSYSGKPVEAIVSGTAQNHTITGVAVNATAGAAGLFGAPTKKLEVSDLTLIDFSITGSGDAGALAGTLTNGATLTNVLAYNSDILLPDEEQEDDSLTDGNAPTGIASTGGSAGGLVGSMTGGSVTGSAAALIVSSEAATGNAGGLIGAAAGVRVEDSYAGGHTDGITGKYSTSEYNVTVATGNAGGLIGAASGTTDIRFSYATCSASGKVAGGLIGAADGNAVAVSHSYAVGKAAGTDAQGTFLGGGQILVQALNESGSATAVSKTKADLDFVYAVDLDSEDLLMPKDIPTGEAAWKVRLVANPYDIALVNAPVSRKYPFPTVNQLHQLNNESSYDPNAKPDFLGTHYGDWEEIKLLADVNLELINAERLSAKITLPVAQIGEGRKITMLIHGDTTNEPAKDAYLVLQVTKATDPSAAVPYVLSLSTESVVPGVESDKLTEWFDKLKKDDTGFDITGTGDDAIAAIELNLDDITAQDKHFKQLFSEFKPGENIVAAVKGGVVSAGKLNDIVADEESWIVIDDTKPIDEQKTYIAARTNSLFADPATTDKPDGTNIDEKAVAIANFRHLENLDAAVSGLDTTNLGINKAVQIVDLSDKPADGDQPAVSLSWAGFKAAINAETPDNVVVYTSEATPTPTSAGCYRPVSPDYALVYDGGYDDTDEDGTTVQKSHTITGVKVDIAGDAGLFGKLLSGSNIHDLELIDFNITGTTSAGALAGTLNDVIVENIVVHDSDAEDKTTAVSAASGNAGGLVGSMTGGSVSNALIYGSAATVTATGNAGGLIGSMSGATPKVEYCAAALLVKSTGGDAGGLIGAANGGEVSGSYSGGHTSNGAYTTDYNVVTMNATGNAGGLIGSAVGASVKNCYSTCSATGTTAGGLVGTASGSIDNCYATGLVGGINVGALTGSMTNTFSGCLYYETVNPGMSATGNAVEGVPVIGVTEIDADLKTYRDFVGVSTAWTAAEPYDAQLKADYPNSDGDGAYLYNLKGISRLENDYSTTGRFVETHYGDWPVPGIQVQNTSTD